MILNEDKKIEDLINDAYNERIWLPEFQRPFVWDKNQIRLIIDSLYQNYTISSILTWKGNDELSRRRVGGGISDIKVPLNNSEELITYLLDGQQRTTALTYVFTDKIIFRNKNKTPLSPLNLYYDSEYKGDEAEKRWLFDDEVVYDNENSEHFFKIKDLLRKEELYQRFNTRFIKIKHLMIDNFENELSLENKDDKKYKFLFEYGKIVSHLKDKILKRKVVDIEQRGSLNSVLEVFERINTKNTKLSIFDIMVAKTYKKFDEGYFDLRTYLKIITSEERSVKDNYFENIKNLKDIENHKNPFLDELLLFLIMIILKQEFKATFIIKISTNDLLNNIKKIHFILKRTLEILNNFHIEYDEINHYKPIAKFIVAFLARYEKDTSYSSF